MRRRYDEGVQSQRKPAEKPASRSVRQSVVTKAVGTVSGVLQGVDGVSKPGVAIALLPPRQRNQTDPDAIRVTKTDAFGSFRFDDIPAGRYRLAAIPGTVRKASAVYDFADGVPVIELLPGQLIQTTIKTQVIP